MARLLTILSLVVAAIGYTTTSSTHPTANTVATLALGRAAGLNANHRGETGAAQGSSSSSSSPLDPKLAAEHANTKFPLRALPPLNINPNTFTISGISAGAAMTVQFQIAFSSMVRAAGTIAGIPFMCSQYGGAVAALSCMDDPYTIDPVVLLAYVDTFANLGTIDSPALNLPSQMTMVFSGVSDTVVKQGTVRIIDQMYSALGIPAAQRYQVYNVSAEHSWVTNDYGQACSYLGSPYINNCEYDFGGIFLRNAFNHMQQPPLRSKGSYNSDNLFKFSQAAFGASSLISMDTVAFAYIPTACQNGTVQCHLHVNFHGCNQQRSAFPQEEDLYVSHTGLNKWAETNNIVILYPQTIASSLLPYNPQGCFDWWGYTDVYYAQQAGLQMQVVRSMIRNVAGF